MYAVIERHVGQMCTLAEEALASDDPGEAFFDFARAAAELGMTTPGLHKCVAHCGEKPCAAELDELGSKIVARAQRAGTLRRDIEPSEVGSLIRAALLAAPAGQWRLYLDVVLEGLRA
jgi:predicted trehalose synthase